MKNCARKMQLRIDHRFGKMEVADDLGKRFPWSGGNQGLIRLGCRENVKKWR